MSAKHDPHVVETYRMKADSMIHDLSDILDRLRCIDNAVGLDGRHHFRLELLSNALTDLAHPKRSAAE